MMNEQVIKIGLESNMLNYVDNETPRHYFLSGNADEQDLAKFAELIVQECLGIINSARKDYLVNPLFETSQLIKDHFEIGGRGSKRLEFELNELNDKRREGDLVI